MSSSVTYGAFTGADRPRKGRFEAANDGTLFLDEIGEMPLSLQVKLLRVCAGARVRALGSDDPKESHLRLVAATNRDLDECVEAGTFRQDLLYRLDVVRLDVSAAQGTTDGRPPARQSLPQFYAAANRSEVSGFSEEAMTLMQSYGCPNVRELENLIQGHLGAQKRRAHRAR